MTGRKSDQKQEQKLAQKQVNDICLQYKELSSADKEDVHVQVPILEWEINISKNRARQGVQSVLNGMAILNVELMSFIDEAASLIIQAVNGLKDTLTNKAAPEATLKALDALRGPLKKMDELDCPCCTNTFNMTDKENGLSPAINSQGEMYCKDCMLRRGAQAFSNEPLEPLGQKAGKPFYSLINHPLINCLNSYTRFTEKFIDTVKALMLGAAQPVAEEKSSHTTTTSSSSSVQAVAIPDPKDLDPEMMIFLLEMGISSEFFPSLNFHTVFEKLSPLTQQRCFTEPTEKNSKLVYEVCVDKDFKKFPKAFFDVAKRCVNAPDEAGRTALMQAVVANDIPGAEMLFSFGANVKAVDNDGDNILHYWARMNEDQFGPWSLFLAKLNEKLDLDETKESKQKPQTSQQKCFVDAPNKLDVTPLVAAFQKKNFDFAVELINLGANPGQSFDETMSLLMYTVKVCGDQPWAAFLVSEGASFLREGKDGIVSEDDNDNLLIGAMDGEKVKGDLEIFTWVLENIKKIGKTKKYTDNVNALKQAALEFAAIRAKEFDSEDFVRYMIYMESLIKEGAQISKDFVNKLPEGSAKNLLEVRLKIRSEKRTKNENKKKKESKLKAKLKESNGSSLPPEQILTQRSKLCLEMLGQAPSLFDVAPLDSITKHFETEGDSCVRHLTQLLESKQDQEASAFFDAMVKILKENQLNVITALKKMDYSDSQLTSLIWVFNKKMLEVSALMERFMPSVTPPKIPVTDQTGRSSAWGSFMTFLPSPRPSPSNAADSKISSSLSTQQSGNSSGVGSPPSSFGIATVPPSDDKDSNFLVKRQLQGLKSAKSKELIDSFNKLPSVVNKDNFEDVWKCFCSCAKGCMTHRENLGKASILEGELAAFQGLLITKVNQIFKIFLDSSLSEEQKEMMKQWAETNVYSRLCPAAMQSSSELQPVGGKSPGLG